MINAAFVRECKARAKMYEVTCDALPGFILRVLPTGKKVALVRYRVAGKDHRARIGLLGPTLTIDGGMPQHGHGLPTRPRVTQRLGAGAYLVEGVRFNMGGWWEFSVTIAVADVTDTVTFNLDL